MTKDAGRIKLHRADLIRFIYELSVELRVHYETPPPRRLLYHGGSLSHGEVIDFKRNLLSSGNVKNHALSYDVHSVADDPSLLYLNQSQKPSLSRDQTTSNDVADVPILPGD